MVPSPLDWITPIELSCQLSTANVSIPPIVRMSLRSGPTAGKLGQQGQVLVPGEAYVDMAGNSGSTGIVIALDMGGSVTLLRLTGAGLTDPCRAVAVTGLVAGAAGTAAASTAAALAGPTSAGQCPEGGAGAWVASAWCE